MDNIKKIMQKYNLHAVKKFGQNFLTDKNIISKIINASNCQKNDGILEIGPGLGHLTTQLVQHATKLVTVEIDKKLVPILKTELGSNENLIIINDDFLQLDLELLVTQNFLPNQKIHIIANLPYYITSAILLKLLAHCHLFASFTLTMQKEVAQRLSARPKTKQYNNLSIMCQFYCDVKLLFDISPKAFFPQPQVTSSVVHFAVKPPLPLLTSDIFWNFVRSCFAYKRKTLVNNLEQYVGTKEKAVNIINSLNWSLTIRAEELTFDMFYQLFMMIKAKKV